MVFVKKIEDLEKNVGRLLRENQELREDAEGYLEDIENLKSLLSSAKMENKELHDKLALKLIEVKENTEEIERCKKLIEDLEIRLDSSDFSVLFNDVQFFNV